MENQPADKFIQNNETGRWLFWARPAFNGVVSGKSRTRSLTGNKSAVSQGRERRIVSLKSRASFLFGRVQCWSQGEGENKKEIKSKEKR